MPASGGASDNQKKSLGLPARGVARLRLAHDLRKRSKGGFDS
jgi:hypothetical protein